MMDADWLLEKMKTRLIVRLRIDPMGRNDLFPNEFRGFLIGRTDRLDTRAGGYVFFDVCGPRLEHFQVWASDDDVEVEAEFKELIKNWKAPWDQEAEHVCEIAHTHLRGNVNQLPLSTLLVIQHLTLVQGMLYQAKRPHRTKAENALLGNMIYQFHSITADANAVLFAGI